MDDDEAAIQAALEEEELQNALVTAAQERAYAARDQDRCVLLWLPYSDADRFERMEALYLHRQLFVRTQFLRRMPVFRTWLLSYIKRLAEIVTLRYYEPGE